MDLNVIVTGLPSGVGASQDAGCRGKGIQGDSWLWLGCPGPTLQETWNLTTPFLQLDRMPQVPSLS